MTTTGLAVTPMVRARPATVTVSRVTAVAQQPSARGRRGVVEMAVQASPKCGEHDRQLHGGRNSLWRWCDDGAVELERTTAFPSDDGVFRWTEAALACPTARGWGGGEGGLSKPTRNHAGWHPPWMEMTTMIRRKTGDGGGAPVTCAGHTAHGQMGGLPGAPNRWKLTRGKKTVMGARRPRCGSSEEKIERKWGPVWAHLAEKKRKGLAHVAQRTRGGGGGKTCVRGRRVAWHCHLNRRQGRRAGVRYGKKEVGAWANPGKRAVGRALRNNEFFYSNNFQTSLICFDRKVDLPNSIFFK
jgi:hypothetical protein